MIDSRCSEEELGNKILNEAISLLNSKYDYVTLVSTLSLDELKETLWLSSGYLENRSYVLPFTKVNFNLLVDMAYHHLEDRIESYEPE